jgi:hypothetical protein
MARRLRIPKNEESRIQEAMSNYRFMYEDADAIIFEVEDEKAEAAASASGGLLNMDED